MLRWFWRVVRHDILRGGPAAAHESLAAFQPGRTPRLTTPRQDDVRERVWQQRRGDLIVDRRRTSAVPTPRSSSGRGDEVARDSTDTNWPNISLHDLAGHVVLHHGHARTTATTTASPTSSDCSTPILFPEPHRVGPKAGERSAVTFSGLGPDCPWALRPVKKGRLEGHGGADVLFPDRRTPTQSRSG